MSIADIGIQLCMLALLWPACKIMYGSVVR